MQFLLTRYFARFTEIISPGFFTLVFCSKTTTMNRKSFLRHSSIGLSGLFFINDLAAQGSGSQGTDVKNAGQPGDPEPYKLDLVKEFVIAGHGDFTRTQSMLKDNPNLVFSKFDWGNGDFEAAIEGAGHVGNKEIALFLIDAGSRVTLFVLAMLGRTDLVKPVLEAYPKLIFAHGPHGFTLLHHAKVGGKDGEELSGYLQEKGLKEDWVKIR
jgi:hypothetical protein